MIQSHIWFGGLLLYKISFKFKQKKKEKELVWDFVSFDSSCWLWLLLNFGSNIFSLTHKLLLFHAIITHIYDYHIKFEVSLHFWRIWPTVWRAWPARREGILHWRQAPPCAPRRLLRAGESFNFYLRKRRPGMQLSFRDNNYFSDYEMKKSSCFTVLIQSYYTFFAVSVSKINSNFKTLISDRSTFKSGLIFTH